MCMLEPSARARAHVLRVLSCSGEVCGGAFVATGASDTVREWPTIRRTGSPATLLTKRPVSISPLCMAPLELPLPMPHAAARTSDAEDESARALARYLVPRRRREHDSNGWRGWHFRPKQARNTEQRTRSPEKKSLAYFRFSYGFAASVWANHGANEPFFHALFVLCSRGLTFEGLERQIIK